MKGATKQLISMRLVLSTWTKCL